MAIKANCWRQDSKLFAPEFTPGTLIIESAMPPGAPGRPQSFWDGQNVDFQTIIQKLIIRQAFRPQACEILSDVDRVRLIVESFSLRLLLQNESRIELK